MPSPWTIADTRSFFVTDLADNAWTLKEAIPTRTESGPDLLVLTYEGLFKTVLKAASPALTAYDRGVAPPSYAGPGTWRITSAVPRRLHGPFWALDVTAKGAISTQEPKVRWITGSESMSAEQINVSGYGIVPRLQSRQPAVGCEISYLSTEATPTIPDAGVAAVPADPKPPTPTNIWSSLDPDIAVIHYPNGWVRESVDTDRIVPGLWWITEMYVYEFEVTAG